MPVVRGASHYQTKLTDALVNEMRAKYATGEWSYAQLSEVYEIDKSSVGRIVLGQTWKHLPVLPTPSVY